MVIIQATQKEKHIVLDLLIAFKRYCYSELQLDDSILSNEKNLKNISDFFDDEISKESSTIFLAQLRKEYAGIITVYKIPQFRSGIFIAEVEEFFVLEEFRWSGVAEKLMKQVEKWCKENNITQLRLESSNILKRGHNFYEKYWFESYGKAFIKTVN